MRDYKITRNKGEWYHAKVTDSYGNEYELQDKSELDLTTYELLLENLFIQKINDEIEIENLIKNIKL